MFNFFSPISRRTFVLLLITFFLLLVISECKTKRSPYRDHRHRTTKHKSTFPLPKTRKVCMRTDTTLKARQKSCFLRPDTGPCRADIIQWYFDVRERKCFRFFWGGCQGNGNRFDTWRKCNQACYLNATSETSHIPYFCDLEFDYGTCFGYYNRFTWDKLTKTCRSRIYSGCGGNQNNFESVTECIATCMKKPNNTLQRVQQFTTCIPFQLDELY